MSNKLLIISGPTATGKTALAIKLAKIFNGELISADSRQIYQGMDIGTGKDHPKNIKINLIDIIKPNEVFSVAQYRRLALKEISRIQSENKLPILVGGSGQYIDSIINPQPTFSIKPNNFLRFFLNKFSVKTLQIIYKLLDKNNYLLLNNSDINNSRRLIRKIEIKLSKNKNNNLINNTFDVYHVSLTAPNTYIFPKIDIRIQQRLKSGLLKEIKTLLKTYKWSDPGLKTIAYKEFKVGAEFIRRGGLACALKDWSSDEKALARRQKTWFKKIPNISYIDIAKPNFTDKTIALIKKWYNLV